MKDSVVVLIVLAVTFLLLLATPVLLVWSANTLFGTGIPYDAKHLFASWVLLFVIRFVTRTEVKKDQR